MGQRGLLMMLLEKRRGTKSARMGENTFSLLLDFSALHHKDVLLHFLVVSVVDDDFFVFYIYETKKF